MAYVGNTPADKTLKLEKQQFTTSATTTYTLSHSVSDPQDIALFINNVRQNPNSSYTVSGTTLTLSAATASTDTMYCVFLGRAIGTVGIGAGSVTKDKVDFISDSSGSGVISKGDGSSIDGSIQLNCHVNSHGIKLKSPPHSAGQSYTLTFPSTAPSSGKFIQTDGSGNLSFATAGVLLQQKFFSNSTRITTSGQSADLELFTYTTSFVKQSNDSELHIWFNVPYEGSVQGAQNGMLQWTHSDGTVTQFFGSRQYVYIPTHSSFQGGVGMLDGMKSGTYTIKQFITSNGNSGNSGGSYNPNGSDDNRYEFSTDTQGASGTAGSKSTLIIQEITG